MSCKIDFKKFYESRIKVIEQDMKIAYRKGNWTAYNNLKAEKKQIQSRIKELYN